MIKTAISTILACMIAGCSTTGVLYRTSANADLSAEASRICAERGLVVGRVRENAQKMKFKCSRAAARGYEPS